MNILQIIPNKGWGGGEKVVFELSQALEQEGNNVVVIIPNCPIVESKFANSPLQYIKLNFRGPLGIGALPKLAKVIKANKIEIIHTHLFKHAAVALIARAVYGLDVKVIMTRHICKPGKRNLHYPTLYNRLDRLIFVSHYAKAYFLSSAPPIDEAKIGVIHNSIKTDKLFSEPFVDSSGGQIVTKIASEQPSAVRIGYAGSISYLKGADLLVSALGTLKREGLDNFHLFIAGRGHKVFMDILEELIKSEQLSAKVSFIGFIEDTIGFYNSVDFVVSPSRIAEAGSLSIFEAMASARATIATEGSSNEVISDSVEGYIVPRGDKIALGSALSKLITNSELRLSMGEKIKLRFDNNFTYTAYLTNYTKLYKSLK